MSESGRNFSIIEYYGKQSKNSCGYCKQSDSCHSHGMQAHCVTNQDYQELIDRGWRRSGTYCYKPKNDETCCPCYTIKCDTSTFTLSKSHKKIIKRLNKFLVDGIADKGDMSNASHQSEQQVSIDMEGHFLKTEIDVDKAKDIVMHTLREKNRNNENHSKDDIVATNPGCSEDHIFEDQISENRISESKKCDRQASVDQSLNEISSTRKPSVVGPDNSKPLRKKAKLMRMERKAEKLASANKLADNIPKKTPKNVQKNLDTFLNEVQDNSRHKLEVKLYPSAESNNCIEVYKLYRKYQMDVHKDKPSKLTKYGFERFLVNSPLKVKLLPVAGNEQKLCSEELSLFKTYQTVIHNDDEPDATEFGEFLIVSPLELEQSSHPTVQFGSFHQQYWLDDKLIAVGVIDILPSCVSSVYFFYDPDYSFLSLGTYGSLREIHLVQQLQQQVNSINSYYMGFYIHSCPKMRYKGKLHSSYLLCPETYTWHLLDDRIIEALNVSKYQRLNDDLSVQDVNQFTVSDLDDIMILYKARTFMTFPQLIQNYPWCAERSVFQTYGQLVGKSVSSRIVMLVA